MAMVKTTGEHDQSFARQHLLLQPTDRLLGQGIWYELFLVEVFDLNYFWSRYLTEIILGRGISLELFLVKVFYLNYSRFSKVSQHLVSATLLHNQQVHKYIQEFSWQYWQFLQSFGVNALETETALKWTRQLFQPISAIYVSYALSTGEWQVWWWWWGLIIHKPIIIWWSI